MTRKHFWTDPYARTHETRVASVAGPAITVESTIFYAESGGQESDAGTIGGRRVLRADKRDRDIVYTLDDAAGLAADDP
ncbi:MAG: alanyl-tRNA editing protein, partial [Deltaproteobacteria bacterium]|nr:alanyl-tRNA editing protein [Deltaproteobacteria bacterium]